MGTQYEDRTMGEIIWWLVCWGLWQHNIHPRGCRRQILASGVHRPNQEKNIKENALRRTSKTCFVMCSHDYLWLFLKFKAMVKPAPRREATLMQLGGNVGTQHEDRTMGEIIWWLVCWGLWQHNIHPRGYRHQILASGVHRLTYFDLYATQHTDVLA